jgi:FkbM family methyltransferase
VSAVGRVRHKAAELRAWTGSVASWLDWPAVALLVLFRTRPPRGQGLWPRTVRRLLPRIWLRPRLLGGLWVSLDPTRLAPFPIYEEVFIEGVYDLDLVRFEPDAVLDCGAFEGYFSLLARARFPQPPIVAFEPDAANYAGLVSNASDLGIETRPAAVSTIDGHATFSGSGCGGHLGTDLSDPHQVAVSDLTRVVAELKSERLLLKLDVEGEEARLLPALLPVLPPTCGVFFEWHHQRSEYVALTEQLGAHGFTTALIRERIFDGQVFIDAFAQRA